MSDSDVSTPNTPDSTNGTESGKQGASNTNVAPRSPDQGLRRRDPFSMFNDVETMMDRMFGRRWPLLRGFSGFQGGDSDWAPQIDVYEKNNTFIVKAELPGINKDDISVTIDEGDLILQGERKSEHQETGENNYYRMERSYGSFYRRIPMPSGVQEGDISASFSDGVLEITAPLGKAEVEQSKKIPIS